jgi:hypothetical protein
LGLGVTFALQQPLDWTKLGKVRTYIATAARCPGMLVDASGEASGWLPRRAAVSPGKKYHSNGG